VTSAAPAAWSGAPARDEPVGRYWSDLVWLLAGAALPLLSAVPVHADRSSKLEADIFRLVNQLPDIPFAVVWVPMQLGTSWWCRRRCWPP
jgi:hypothetical protein